MKLKTIIFSGQASFFAINNPKKKASFFQINNVNATRKRFGRINEICYLFSFFNLDVVVNNNIASQACLYLVYVW